MAKITVGRLKEADTEDIRRMDAAVTKMPSILNLERMIKEEVKN